MALIPGTNLAAPIVPFDTSDTFPTHDSIYGLGGWREITPVVVAGSMQTDAQALAAIPAPRVREGMVVHVLGSLTYQYLTVAPATSPAWFSLVSLLSGTGSFDPSGSATTAQTNAEAAAATALTAATTTLNAAIVAAQGAATTAAESAASTALATAVSNFNTAITAAIGTAESFATAADTTLSGTLSAAIVAAIATAKTYTDTETTRAEAAELVLTNGLSGEVTRAENAEVLLTGNLTTEVSRAEGAEATLGTSITSLTATVTTNAGAVATEVSRAEAAESTLTGSVTTVTTDLANEVSRATGAEGTLTTNLGAEVTRATGAENSLGSSITTLTATVDSNATTAASATSTETSRAEGAEGTLTTNLGAEVLRATAAEGVITGNVTTITTDISNETSRATAAEGVLTTGLGAEVTRATGVEATLTSAAATEVTNRTDADTALGTLITNLTTTVTDLSGTESSAVSVEATARIAGDAATLTAAEAFATAADVTNLAAAKAFSANATNLTSGTVAAALLPVPSITTLGGVQAVSEVASNWISSITSFGVPTLSQPAASDITFDNVLYPTVEAALTALFYVPLVTNLTNTIGTVELGTTVESVVLNWTYSKPTVTSQSFDSGIGPLAVGLRTDTVTIASPGLNNANKTYTLTVNDGTKTTTAQTTVSFLPSVYWGVSPTLPLTSAEVLALGSSALAGSRGRTMTYNATGGNYPIYAYPASFEAPSSVFVGGLALSGYTVTAQDVTNAQGYTQSYNVCAFDNIQNGASITVVWS